MISKRKVLFTIDGNVITTFMRKRKFFVGRMNFWQTVIEASPLYKPRRLTYPTNSVQVLFVKCSRILTHPNVKSPGYFKNNQEGR